MNLVADQEPKKRRGFISKIIWSLKQGGASAAVAQESRDVALIDSLLGEVAAASQYLHHVKLAEFASGRQILELDPPNQIQVVMESTRRLSKPHGRSWAVSELQRHAALKAICSELFRKSLPYSTEQILTLLEASCQGRLDNAMYGLPIGGLFAVIRKRYGDDPLPDTVVTALRQLGSRVRKLHDYAEFRTAALRIDELLHGKSAAPPVKIARGEAWSDAALADLSAMPEEPRNHWARLLMHARTADSSKPTRKWLGAVDEIIGAIGQDAFDALASRWLSLVPEGRTERLPVGDLTYTADPNALIPDEHATLLKGLAWSCVSSTSPDVARALGDAAIWCFKKVNWHGPRCPRLANACVCTLGMMNVDEAGAQLARLTTKVKRVSGRKRVESAVQTLSRRTGQSEDDILEIGVPTFDLSADGTLLRQFGDFSAKVSIVDSTSTELSWSRSDGRVQKSVPADVKRDFAEDLKSLQRTVRDIEKMLPAQRDRIERLFLQERTWKLADWRARYAEHPLVGTLARRLIWLIDGESVLPTNRQFIRSSGEPRSFPETAEVRIWHPAMDPPAEVLEWRRRLEEMGVTQPFKQAHREIYLLTAAEQQTSTYSNRFASHVIRQHQFQALCQQRGWEYRLMGQFDSHNIPTLQLPRLNLRVEFWVEAVNAAATGPGIFLHVATDQVRFYNAGDPHADPMPLVEVPPLVFTEVMRDVDLFVGVASVGNDPNWADGGPGGGYRDYWNRVSFGDLAESAKTRRAVLETLLLRLTKIRDRCRLEDKFLIVRGDIRSYKIHLGSGNILMEPNDQYLCIVPDRRPAPGGEKLFLPFEGDGMLAIVLSKAFMLADDRAIEDETIVRQIKPD